MKRRRSGNFITFLLTLMMFLVIGALAIFLIYQYQTNKEEITSKVSGFLKQESEENKQTEENHLEVGEVENSLDKIQSIYPSDSHNGVKVQGYYYAQLDTTAKKIYDALANNSEILKTGTGDIVLGDQFSNVLSQENGQERLGDSFQAAWDAFSVDRPDIFYIDTSKMYLHMEEKRTLLKTTYHVYIGKGSNANYFSSGFPSKEAVNNAIGNVENVTNQITSSLSGSAYDKIKGAHDWIVDNVKYDETLQRVNTNNIYGTLIEKDVVCEGYADTFKYLMDEMGIPCVIVSGNASNSQGKTESHAWNYVELNGTWYAVDTTWDDPVLVGGGRLPKSEKYKYFLKGSELFDKDHFSSGKVTEKGQTFTYPELSRKNYEN